ncbi:MAG: hypothetical protein GKS07_02745 [Nitrosopumilus sp.]|nr:MAG: hypothetical protein GKS07_02745 [Nitrosopumilus sp.]
MKSNSLNKLLPFFIFLFFLLIFLLSSGGHSDHYDGVVAFLKVENMAINGTPAENINSPSLKFFGFDLETHIGIKASMQAYYLYEKNKEQFIEQETSREEFREEFLESTDFENFYGPNYILLPIVATPLYIISTILDTSPVNFVPLFLNSTIIAINAVLVFFIGTKLYCSQRIGFVLSVLFGTTTFMWPYVTSMFHRPLAILFLLVFLYLILNHKQKISIKKSFFAGISLGFMVFLILYFRFSYQD